MDTRKICQRCGGSGILTDPTATAASYCDDCGGSGYVWEAEAGSATLHPSPMWAAQASELSAARQDASEWRAASAHATKEAERVWKLYEAAVVQIGELEDRLRQAGAEIETQRNRAYTAEAQYGILERAAEWNAVTLRKISACLRDDVVPFLEAGDAVRALQIIHLFLLKYSDNDAWGLVDPPAK